MEDIRPVLQENNKQINQKISQLKTKLQEHKDAVERLSTEIAELRGRAAQNSDVVEFISQALEEEVALETQEVAPESEEAIEEQPN